MFFLFTFFLDKKSNKKIKKKRRFIALLKFDVSIERYWLNNEGHSLVLRQFQFTPGLAHRFFIPTHGWSFGNDNGFIMVFYFL
jgi:hypothetical protein